MSDYAQRNAMGGWRVVCHVFVSLLIGEQSGQTELVLGRSSVRFFAIFGAKDE